MSFSYSGGPPWLLEDICLAVRPGEYLSVVGENGSGKSTLVKLLLGFLKPSRGTVSVAARRIGYVPQRTEANAGFPITVGEMLDSYRRLLRVRDRGVVAESLRQAGLSDRQGVLMGTLSGGQAQKALIARALIGSPELLVLDEPSTGVDFESQREIYGLIRRLNTEKGITVLSVEHNLDAVVRNSTLIYHISGARGHACSPEKYAAEFLPREKGGDDRRV